MRIAVSRAGSCATPARWLCALFWWPLLTTTALGDDIGVPAQVQGNPGEFIVVTATTKGDTVRWHCATPGLSMIPPRLLSDSKSVVVMAAQPGTYKLIAWTAVNNQPSECAVCLVAIGTPPVPPAPTPPAPPTPPGPTPPTELMQALTDALTKDGKTSANLDACKKVAAVARILADKGKNDTGLKTAGDVYTLWSQSVKNIVQPTDITQTRLAIGAYLNSKLPTSLTAALDASTRQQLYDEFSRVAAALEVLK